MKSVTIKDHKGKVLIKVVHRKDGTYNLIKKEELSYIKVEAKAVDGSRVYFKTEVE